MMLMFESHSRLVILGAFICVTGAKAWLWQYLCLCQGLWDSLQHGSRHVQLLSQSYGLFVCWQVRRSAPCFYSGYGITLRSCLSISIFSP